MHVWLKCRSDKIITIMLLIVCAIFILGGAVNNGFSWFVMAIPFVVVYVKLLKGFNQPQKACLIALLLLFCSPIFIDKSHSTLFYPCLGSKVTLAKGWGYVQFVGSKHYSLIKPDALRDYANVKVGEMLLKPLKVFSSPVEMTMSEMGVSFADFGTTLEPVFMDKTGNSYSINSYSFNNEIRRGSIKTDDLSDTEELQSYWTERLGLLMTWPVWPVILLS